MRQPCYLLSYPVKITEAETLLLLVQHTAPSTSVAHSLNGAFDQII